MSGIPTIGALHSSPVVQRHPRNPVLTKDNVPYTSDLVFNAGAVKYQGKYVMVFRNDYRNGEDLSIGGTNIGLATSDDGVRWEVSPKPCFDMTGGDIRRAYDPRLTVIGGRVAMCFAVDTQHGIRGGIALTDDFETFDVKSLSVPDNRNMVLFPEKIGGMYVRLERPFPIYSRGAAAHKFDIWLSESPDLVFWGRSSVLLDTGQVPFCNDKVGPASPPVRTGSGWLATFHAVDVDPGRGKNGWEPAWKKRYTAGLMLLDLDNPRKVLGYTTSPLLVPEAPYEIDGGFRNNVIFPGGMILEDSGEVKIYYGAADAVECLATANVDDLIALCLAGSPA